MKALLPLHLVSSLTPLVSFLRLLPPDNRVGTCGTNTSNILRLVHKNSWTGLSGADGNESKIVCLTTTSAKSRLIKKQAQIVATQHSATFALYAPAMSPVASNRSQLLKPCVCAHLCWLHKWHPMIQRLLEHVSNFQNLSFIVEIPPECHKYIVEMWIPHRKSSIHASVFLPSCFFMAFGR